MVVENQMRWRFSNDLLRFRVSCFSLKDAVSTAVILFSLCGNSYKGDIFQEEAAAAKSLQSCPTLCDPIDGNPPGSSVPRILHARILEWVAISFYIRQNCFLYKKRILVISCQYNMP